MIRTQNKNTTSTSVIQEIQRKTFEQLELQQDARVKPDAGGRIASPVPLIMLLEKSQYENPIKNLEISRLY
jgi:hypothetical protein